MLGFSNEDVFSSHLQRFPAPSRDLAGSVASVLYRAPASGWPQLIEHPDGGPVHVRGAPRLDRGLVVQGLPKHALVQLQSKQHRNHTPHTPVSILQGSTLTFRWGRARRRKHTHASEAREHTNKQARVETDLLFESLLAGRVEFLLAEVGTNHEIDRPVAIVRSVRGERPLILRELIRHGLEGAIRHATEFALVPAPFNREFRPLPIIIIRDAE